MELGLTLQPQAVERPWDCVLQLPDGAPRPLPPNSKITDVFAELKQALLILGAPGSGKSTLMLELARDRLAQARRNASLPVPVVFHLSTWAGERLALADWLVDELDKRYDLPARIGRACVAGAHLLVLQVTSTCSATPTMWVNGRCRLLLNNQELTAIQFRGCHYWLMVVDNSDPQDPQTGRTPDIVSFLVFNANGRRIAYGTGPVVQGNVTITPTSN
jgi:hypothetical protein